MDMISVKREANEQPRNGAGNRPAVAGPVEWRG